MTNHLQSQKFCALDGMRGFAAFLVVALHSQSFWGGPISGHAYLAVDLFFVLSGFVIGHAYQQRIVTYQITAPRFLLIRWIRLFPMLALGSILGFAAAASGTDAPVPALSLSLLAGLFFLPWRVEGALGMFALNFPLWSLFFEMIASAAYSIVARWSSVKIMTVILVPAGALMISMLVLNGSLDLGILWARRHFAGGLLRSLYGFFVGILLCRLFQRRNAQRHARNGISAWWPMLLAVATLKEPAQQNPDEEAIQ